MPDYLVGQKRDIMTFVKVHSAGNLFYGWNAKDFTATPGVSSADTTALGHMTATAVAAITGAIAIIGANAPKPARFRKVLNENPSAAQQGIASTFCGADAYATALTAGWKLSKSANSATISNNARTVTVGARCTDGGIYLFPMNAARAAEVAGDLGLILPAALSSAERLRCFTGTSYPRPAQVKKPGVTGDKSTFCSSDALDAALALGWQAGEGEKLFPLA